MRSARLQFNGPKALVTVCVFVLAIGAGVNAVEATHDPVVQSTPSKDADSLVTQVDDVKPNSTQSSNAQQLRQKRRAQAFQNRRQAVLDFLEQHFPELKESLLSSEKKSPGKFRGALKRIEKDVTRLQQLEQRQPEKFELVVELWKQKTQIEITIAKYAKIENAEQLDQRLKPLVAEMLDIRKSILNFERQSISKRLAKIEKRLLNLETSTEPAIQHNLRLFRKTANKIRAKEKKKLDQRKSSESKADLDSSKEKP